MNQLPAGRIMQRNDMGDVMCAMVAHILMYFKPHYYALIVLSHNKNANNRFNYRFKPIFVNHSLETFFHVTYFTVDAVNSKNIKHQGQKNVT